MKRSLLAQTLALTILFVLGTINYAQAQSFSVIHNFGDNAGDPLNPQWVGVIAQGRDGDLYSTTLHGGSTRSGTAFKITPGGKVTVLDSFNLIIYSGLALGSDGNFYGSTYNGGTSNLGILFKMTPNGKKLTTLYNFTGGNDGAIPYPPPVQGADGNLYGTTDVRGSSNAGTAYKITPSGKLTTISEFGGQKGNFPVFPLVQGTDGNFYGTTQNGGASNAGVVFKLTPSGNLTVLYSFDGTHGSLPDSALIQASEGNFYGTTQRGGNSNLGVAFKITPKGVLTVLYNFAGKADGGTPWGLVQATDGNLYGATQKYGSGYGTIYKLTLKGKFSVIHTFNVVTGSYPSVALIQHTNGILYGDTYQGGATNNTGVFFKLKIGATPFVSLLPILGKVGATIEFLGQGFTGTTKVSFNGVSANFTVVSNTYLTAVVPAGATTGPVTVTTPGGTLTSNKVFHVRP
jgi:uncharacterized repeat protein (TIGR03803 family)